MHEMSLAESMLQLIEEQAAVQGFRRVKTVWLEIGELAAVEPEALRFCFDAVTRGTLVQDARLEILARAGRGRCRQCAALVPMATLFAACPHCGGYGLEVVGGTEMRVKELEVE